VLFRSDKETIKENFREDVKEGLTKYFYPDGKLKAEVPFVKGLEHGFGREYSPAGEIVTLIEYKRGFVIDRMKINRRDKSNLKQGKWFTFYPNGNIHEEGNYRDDKKDGYFKSYAENGDLVSVTKYIDDVKQEEAAEVTKLDVYNEYYPDGKIKTASTYRNGILEGVYREYNPDGQVVKSIIYKNGVINGEGIVLEDGSKEGHWKEYYPDGALMAEGDFKENKPVGEWKYFYPDGKIEEQGKYSNSGKLTGTWKWYFENGQLKTEESYLSGLKDGTHTEYDVNGKVIDAGEYIKGVEDGPWFTICGDYVERGSYRDGLKTGKWISYYFVNDSTKRDSTLAFTGSFVDDNPDGKHVYYWDNGKVRTEGPYIMGKKEGDWILYNWDGTPFLIITYKNGTEIRYDGARIKPPFESGEN
jgi:antitoxin component YwqK of YwqJK toxin-antitoxin module